MIMRGEVLHYDEGQGFGFITAADGSRYTFTREDLRRQVPISKGMAVEFRQDGSQARDVFSIRAQLSGGMSTEAPPPPQQFGRAPTMAPVYSAPPGNLGLWGYFWRAATANYANFRDRARRKEFWGFVLFYILAWIAVGVLGLLVDNALGLLDEEKPYVSVTLSILFFLAMLIPGVAVTVRRQHDIGLSGWFYLLAFLPYIGGMILLVFSLIPSQKHENKWGPVPEGVRI
jgi:uncharacterized membrane protein YhaH (DUF805 family)/cold shock CspA family protein